ncbi:hypothetical protein LEP1GSC036_3339 [Leptospira weilii str. 2006001853]|uniref:Uncharacterized protein n=4 Tax=Leptospira weilii TaxID=28184 RepID=A0A828Z2X0_9LEPT|nr:hypothetical protein LEP1GSC036_3339 [Leptospira weilii str. 2006001853]EMJ67144.1 hypothetical protein LEP1GSC051_3730 [Leptospira sp. P2653]EMM72904.1 hypothetical protein LEP1GSC038_3529 [Leptospira weilii str. 2006001855]EMN44460.1 hypothetical protein LEP1GSC086_3517 [Leptospira weilii str. LNT 1234]EMN89313.1 hypothetical protein LEP1GSC108_4500 [Leptospira weilii str. UI 13098]EMY14214.1 hypothetical protein LEP1GSC043_2007 [Leptospira weilii str. Ecochallenge]
MNPISVGFKVSFQAIFRLEWFVGISKNKIPELVLAKNQK